MNNTLQSTQESIERSGPPPKKGCGCLLNALIGITVFMAAIALAAWLLLMHSSLPLRGVASLIEEGGAQENLKVTGISGSLSSGLQFKKMTWNNGEFTDVRIRYSGIMDVIRRKQLILYEAHVGSATFEATFDSDKQEDAESPVDSTPAGESTEPPLRLLQIDRVSLNQIVIKDRASGVTLNIPKLEWTGFKAEKGHVEFGNLDAESDYLIVKTAEVSSSRYQRRFEIGILPKMHANILKPIQIVTELGHENDKFIFDLTAFDETLKMTVGEDGIGRLRIEGVNLADFIDGPLPQNLRFNAEVGNPNPDAAGAEIKVHAGTFQLGMKSFEIQPSTVGEPEAQTIATVFLAVSRDGDRQFRYEIVATEAGKEESFKPVLTSTPSMSPEDILANLYHDSEFSSLSPSDQEAVKRRIPWFSFSLPK